MTTKISAKPITTTDPVLDQTVLAQYAQRKTGLLERLVAAYLEETPGFHQELRNGAQAGNFDQVKFNAHVLKSSSSNLGAVRLSQLCQGLESSAVAQDSAEIDRLIEWLGPECFEVEEALKNLVLKLTGKTFTGAQMGTL